MVQSFTKTAEGALNKGDDNLDIGKGIQQIIIGMCDPKTYPHKKVDPDQFQYIGKVLQEGSSSSKN